MGPNSVSGFPGRNDELPAAAATPLHGASRFGDASAVIARGHDDGTEGPTGRLIPHARGFYASCGDQ